MENENDNGNKTCWINSFIPYHMSASECSSISNCSSSGCVQDSDHKVPLSAATDTASIWNWMPERGYQDHFQEHVL